MIFWRIQYDCYWCPVIQCSDGGMPDGKNVVHDVLIIGFVLQVVTQAGFRLHKNEDWPVATQSQVVVDNC